MERGLEFRRYLDRPIEGRAYPIFRQVGTPSIQLLPVPFEGESRRHQEVVVLDELAVWDQELPDIYDLLHAAAYLKRLRGSVGLNEVAVLEQHDRPLDRVAGCYRASLTGTLYLELGAYGDEVVQYDHGCRVHAQRREPGRPGAAISEPETADPRRIRQHGSSG